VGHRRDLLQRHQPVGQQAQGPAAPPGRRRAAGERDEVRLLCAIQRAPVFAVGGLARQRGVQPCGGALLAHAGDRGRVDLQRGGDRRVGPAGAALALVGLQQDARMGTVNLGAKVAGVRY